MEHNTFIQRLSEFAELRKVKIPRSAGQREADTACDIFRNGETFIIDKDNNSTWAWEIKKLKPIIKPCEDCGKECKDRKVARTLYTFPERHWRQHCSSCNRVQDPETKQFDIFPIKAQNHFVALLKKKR
jgi:hypothetical protein